MKRSIFIGLIAWSLSAVGGPNNLNGVDMEKFKLNALLYLQGDGDPPEGGEGTGDGAGGGSTISFQNNTCPFLLDLLEKDSNTEALSDCPEGAVDAGQYKELEPIYHQDEEVLKLAKDKLNSWKLFLAKNNLKSQLVLIHELDDVLNNMSFSRTNRHFAKIQRFSIDKKYARQSPRIETAILYLPLYGGIISSPVWDSVGVNTKVGLIFHETFRQLQGLYKFDDVSDETLQRLTVDVLGEPRDEWKALGEHTKESPLLFRYTTIKGAMLPDLFDFSGDAQSIDSLFESKVKSNIAYSFIEEMNSMLNGGQNQRADSLLSDPAKREILFKSLLRRNILK